MSELSEENKLAVRNFWNNAPEYCSEVSKILQVKISRVELISALMESTGEDFTELVLREWTPESIADVIKDSEIVGAIPEIQEEVHLESSLIPNGVIRNIYEERVKFKGEIWVIHKNDLDPFPSSPHAHNYEAGLKLDLRNGDLYHGTDLVGRIPKKQFKKLRDSFKTTMPTLEV